ncbi:MAG: hypothetical protein KF796_15010 [Ramlibacter sp.]|nr:hypothetical protein [Ramlibacter sp.]
MSKIRNLMMFGALWACSLHVSAAALLARPAFDSNVVQATGSHCTKGQPNINAATLAFFAGAGATGNLRPFFCVEASSPVHAPQYTGDSLTAFTWLSNQLYPGSNGNIRSLYGAANIDWGTLPWPSFSAACGCTAADFEAVKTQLKHEIQSVGDVGALFNSIATYYTNPLFIQNDAIVSAAVLELSLPNQPVTVNTGAVIEKSISDVLQDVFNTGLGDISPWGPVAITALMNLSSASNGGSVPNTVSAAASSLENRLPAAFAGIATQMASLQATIIADYSLYTQIGMYSSGISSQQLTTLSTTGALAYRKQLYRDLLPYVATVVFYAPTDTHLGGGGHAYSQADAATYSAASAPANRITYLHYAGWFWNSKTYYDTTTQLLTSSATFNDGDFATGRLCANNLLNSAIYKTVFTTLGFTYQELLSLPGMATRQQCSLCQSSEHCNAGQCRPNQSCS